MPTTAVKITGDKGLLRLLQDLPDRIGRKVNRRAITKATTPILNAVKDAVPVEHGDLRKSQIKKITNHGLNSNGIVGADANYIVSESTGEKLQLGKDKTENDALVSAARDAGGVIRPAKYDHLVEYGHANRDGSQTAPRPFMHQGWDSSIGTARSVYETELAAGIEAEAIKLASGK